MTRIAFALAATAAFIGFALPAFADSRLFSARSDKEGTTIDQAFANGKALSVAGKGGGVTFFRMDNPAGAIDCKQHLAFVASTGERQEKDVDLCSENWQVTLHLTARAIVTEPKALVAAPLPKPADSGPAPAAAPEPPPPPPAPPAAADAGEPPAGPAPQGPVTGVTTNATQIVTVTTDDPAIGIESVFLERQPVQIQSRQGNSVEIAVAGGPGRITCQRDLGVKLSDGRTMARRVNICDHNWSVLVTLAGEETPPPVAAAPAPPPPPKAPPAVASAPPAEPAPLPPPGVPQGAQVWSFVPDAGGVTLAYGVPRTEQGEFAASCRPGSGPVAVRILRAMPGGQVGGPMRVTLAAGPITRTYQATASPITDVAAGPHPQFNVSPADTIWQALIHESVLVVQLGDAPPYAIPLRGSAQPARQFLAACGGAGEPPVVAGGPPVIAGPPGGGLPYDCNDGSSLQVRFDNRQGTAFVNEPGAPSQILFRVPSRPEVARYSAGPASLVGVGEIIRWSRFGEPARVCRPRL